MQIEKKNKITLKKLDQYYLDLNEQLGNGAFSVVFKGVDSTTNNPIAIKTIKNEQGNKLIEFTKKEVQSLQLIDHENVVKLYDVKKSNTNIYLIMEYCNGSSLEHLIKKKNRLVEDDAISIFKNIIEGMKHLFENQIVHRDLKPANILLHNYQPKIADFGFSKLLDHGMDIKLLTSIVGTPQYMSPQILNREIYSAKTDIWSLGIILYEMLYGKPPFSGQTTQQLHQNIINSKLHFPEFPAISHLIKQLIEKMLQVQEENRISWEELFKYETFGNDLEMKLQQSLENITKSKNLDQFEKQKTLAMLYFDHNIIVNSAYECMKKEKMNKIIMEQLLVDKDKQNLSINQAQDHLSSINQNNASDIAQVIEQNRINQENFHLFSEMGEYILHRRNKAVFFYIAGLQLLDYHTIIPQELQNLLLRTIFLIIKYAVIKLFKAYKRLKSNQPPKVTKFSQKQWEFFLKTEQRSYLLLFISFDFEVSQLFFDPFTQYIYNYFTKIMEAFNQKQCQNEPDSIDDFLQISPPNLFSSQQDSNFFLPEIQEPQLLNQEECEIKLFLEHCSKKIKSKDSFFNIMDSTVKEFLVKVQNIQQTPKKEYLLTLMKIKFSQNSWRQCFKYQKDQYDNLFWSKFYEGLNSQNNDDLYKRIFTQ